MRSLDFALETHNSVRLLENLRFVGGRLIEKTLHLLRLLLHGPLQIDKFCLRLLDFGLDVCALLLLKPDVTRVRHYQLRREQLPADRILTMRSVLMGEGRDCASDYGKKD